MYVSFSTYLADHSSLGGEAIAGAAVAVIVGLVIFSAGIATLVWLAWRSGLHNESELYITAIYNIGVHVLYSSVPAL